MNIPYSCFVEHFRSILDFCIRCRNVFHWVLIFCAMTINLNQISFNLLKHQIHALYQNLDLNYLCILIGHMPIMSHVKTWKEWGSDWGLQGHSRVMHCIGYHHYSVSLTLGYIAMETDTAIDEAEGSSWFACKGLRGRTQWPASGGKRLNHLSPWGRGDVFS